MEAKDGVDLLCANKCLQNKLLGNYNSLPPQGFGPEAKTRGGGTLGVLGVYIQGQIIFC